MNTCYCDKPKLYLRKQGLNSRAFVNLWVFFIFFADWLVNIPDASSTIQTRKILIQMNKTDVAYSLQQNFESRSRFKMPQKTAISRFCKFNLCQGLFGMKNFPAKKLRKNTAPKIRMRQIFFFCFIQVIFFKLSLKW